MKFFKWIYKSKQAVTGLVILIIGGIAIFLGSMFFAGSTGLCANVGYSLLASGIVILIQGLENASDERDRAREWGLDRIYKARSEKSDDSDPKLGRVRQLDVVAFGLKSFRSTHRKKIEEILKNGGRIRILTMDPEGRFVRQREMEEKDSEGQIKGSISDLVTWANELNDQGWPGSIEVKGYQCMTLDFYWRADDEIYFGPYWYHRPSQRTVTYRLKKRSLLPNEGFEIYEDYFEELWNDGEMRELAVPSRKGGADGRS